MHQSYLKNKEIFFVQAYTASDKIFIKSLATCCWLVPGIKYTFTWGFVCVANNWDVYGIWHYIKAPTLGNSDWGQWSYRPCVICIWFNVYKSTRVITYPHTWLYYIHTCERTITHVTPHPHIWCHIYTCVLTSTCAISYSHMSSHVKIGLYVGTECLITRLPLTTAWIKKIIKKQHTCNSIVV